MMLSVIIIVISLAACKNSKEAFINNKLSFSEEQLGNVLNALEEDSIFPRTLEMDGAIRFVGIRDWTSGFFPGSLWYLYELSNNEKWKKEAERTTEWLAPIQYYTGNHDVGFMLNCSYGNGYRLTKNEDYSQVLINGAESLCSRYDSIVGSIKSWDWGKSRDGHKWQFPVIIDNMMNLDLLFTASKLSGNNWYKEVAIAHANSTMNNHFRDDFSSYHVVDYDTISGDVRGKYTFQGYSNESSWARGQAWGLYGFTSCARETGDSKYFEMAEKIADYIINHPSLPEDGVPLWDYDVEDPDYVPDWIDRLPKLEESWRDASAAAVTSSALFELGRLTNNCSYTEFATKLLYSLGNSYTSTHNDYFILEQSVGNLPKPDEINAPLNYADYYFLEALLRFKNHFNK
jgi:rhamnogalacturonyl hydrolase YesR